ncbi:MAG: isopentenyl-diphosphate Delta-isomerase [Calditrichia bacterium]|nr:isopentenyl-diphosphate Delta-isomerase [Calditrichia bacterium]
MSQNVVSFDDEKLILVDKNDNVLGYESKFDCHENDGILHRAFSIFIFNDRNQLLLQKRSNQKLLWPLFWSNSCCSHPRKGEDFKTAIHRRLKEELGIDTDLKYLFKFQYQAAFEDKGSENELCSVYIGRSDDNIIVNENEIAELKFIDIDQMEKEMEKHPEYFTPWFKMEWDRIIKEFKNDIFLNH